MTPGRIAAPAASPLQAQAMDWATATLPRLLRWRAEGPEAHRPALRHKEKGIWKTVSWREYWETARLVALGLMALGLEVQEKVAVVADNIPEWYFMELGTQAAGGVVVGIYQSGMPREIAYGIEATDSVFVMAEDQEQVDKLLEVRPLVPQVRRVIYQDPRGMRRYRDDPWLMSFDELLQLGRDARDRLGPELERRLASQRADDVCLMCFSSGTTAQPKPVMLTHRNLMAMGRSFQQVERFSPTDQFFSFLPLAWIGEQMMAVATGLVVGFTVNCPEEVESALAEIREIGPHLMFSPPRIWEGYVRQVKVKIEDSTPLKRLVFRLGMAVGERVADRRLAGKEVPLWLRACHLLFRWVLYRPLLDRFGLSRLRKAYTAGAALGPDVFRFFHAMGLNLKQGYGQTEIAGIFCFHRDGDVRVETVGVPYPGAEVTISPEGEVLARGESVAAGYYKRPEETARLLEGGWLHTGDAGYLDERGHLVVIDRLSDVMRTADGTVFSPQFLENKLKFSPYVKEAVVFGNGMPYVAALVNVDPATVGKWAEDRKLAYTTYADLSQKPEVGQLILQQVRRVNALLPASQRIRRFALLYKLLDADDGELTRTGKVRRALIQERYRPLVDALYSPEGRVEVSVQFRYQDGRTADVTLAVPVYDAEPGPPDGQRVRAGDGLPASVAG